MVGVFSGFERLSVGITPLSLTFAASFVPLLNPAEETMSGHAELAKA